MGSGNGSGFSAASVKTGGIWKRGHRCSYAVSRAVEEAQEEVQCRDRTGHRREGHGEYPACRGRGGGGDGCAATGRSSSAEREIDGGIEVGYCGQLPGNSQSTSAGLC